MSRWSNAIKEVVTAPRHRPPNRTSQWAHRRRRREQETRSLSPAAEPPADPTQPAEGRDRPSNHRASGYARQAARAKVLQKLYQANPGACMRRLLDNTPLVFCNIGEQELVAHYTATLAEPPPLGPPPAWLFPDRHPGDTEVPGATDEGDVLQIPVTPEEVVTQFKRTKRTASGVDGITYVSWRWVDPQGLILSAIYNACRVNTRIPRAWKHSTVTVIHKGGDVTSVRNWRPISRLVAGFPLVGHTINSLANANNVCVVAASKPELQGLLDQCRAFVAWAGLVFNAKKCGLLCMVNEAPRLYSTTCTRPSWAQRPSRPSPGTNGTNTGAAQQDQSPFYRT